MVSKKASLGGKKPNPPSDADGGQDLTTSRAKTRKGAQRSGDTIKIHSSNGKSINSSTGTTKTFTIDYFKTHPEHGLNTTNKWNTLAVHKVILKIKLNVLCYNT